MKLLVLLLFTTLPLRAQESSLDEVRALASTLGELKAHKRARSLTSDDLYQQFNYAAQAPHTCNREFLREWYALNHRYQELYDEFIIHKQAYIIEQVNREIEHLYYDMDHEVRLQNFPIFVKLQGEFRHWQNYKKMLGKFAVDEAEHLARIGKTKSPQQLQQFRKYSYDRYFTLAQQFNRPSSSGRLGKMLQGSLKASKILGLGLSAPLLGATYWVARSFCATPFYSLGIAGARLVARKTRHYRQVEIEGREHLALIHDTPKKTVNLFLPNHRNDIGDFFLMAALGISPAMVFLNAQIVARMVDRRFERPLGNILATLPELISVGSCKGYHGLSPTDKLLRNLARGLSPNVINYAQGFIANMHEVLGLSPSFVPKLLGPMLGDGYRVRVFPISYEIESSFLWPAAQTHRQAPMVRVAPPLAPEVVAEIYRLESAPGSEMPHLFETIIRAHWIDKIRTFPELSLGEIQQRIRGSLKLENFTLVPDDSKPIEF
jgi:hypothetical protein